MFGEHQSGAGLKRQAARFSSGLSSQNRLARAWRSFEASLSSFHTASEQMAADLFPDGIEERRLGVGGRSLEEEQTHHVLPEKGAHHRIRPQNRHLPCMSGQRNPDSPNPVIQSTEHTIGSAVGAAIYTTRSSRRHHTTPSLPSTSSLYIT